MFVFNARGTDFRVVLAGDSTVIVEFEERIDPTINARAVRLAEAVETAALGGVRDVVPTYRSVAIYFDPLRTDVDRLSRLLELEVAHSVPAGSEVRAAIRVPVCYGGEFGPDLGEVAAFAKMTESDVIAAHSAPVYRVFMMGFVPGFTYLGPVDSRIAAPRRATPRVRVPAGSVGIAGQQTGIYPMETPGGWQLVGRTPLKTFDLSRTEPFRLKAGDLVQFYPIDIAEWQGGRIAESEGKKNSLDPAVLPSCHSFVHVIKPGLQTTIQDLGRWGLQSRGVPVAGPMDPCSHRIANALAGNDPDAATLEITLVGPQLEFEDERIVAVAGAEFALTVDGRSQPMNTPFCAPRGSRLQFGLRTSGSRAYLAIAGGIAVPPILGSRSTHLVSRIGGLDGRALSAGDRLPLGDHRGSPRSFVAHAGFPALPLPGRAARIRVLPGPQRERFADDALDALQSAPYSIRTDSDRMGYRLEGPPLGHAGSADIVSDATPPGALQVPASGQPVLLMADRQTTGGYPKLASVISADISIAGQLAPGDRIVFEACTLATALAALIAQERALMAIEAS